jgi:hypothetical protein
VLLSVGVAPTVAATPSGESTGDGATVDASPVGVVFQETTSDDETDTNETTQHENPDESSGDGSQDAIQQWLVGSVANRLEGGTINLSEGQYEFARSAVGDDFGSDLTRYVNVAGETDTEDDDRTATQFNETRQTQQEFTDRVQEFRDTYDRYQEAKAADDTETARRLARELLQLEDRVNTTGAALLTDYDEISNLTDVSLEDGRRATRNVTQNITSIAETVAIETFVATELHITAVSERASFSDPLAIEGRLVAENGSAVADSEISLSVPGAQPTATTNETGYFTLTYRPVQVPSG